MGRGGGGQFEQDVITYASINKIHLLSVQPGNNSSSKLSIPGYRYVLKRCFHKFIGYKIFIFHFGEFGWCLRSRFRYLQVHYGIILMHHLTEHQWHHRSPQVPAQLWNHSFHLIMLCRSGEKSELPVDNIDAINPLMLVN